jgi:hypothetical protein
MPAAWAAARVSQIRAIRVAACAGGSAPWREMRARRLSPGIRGERRASQPSADRASSAAAMPGWASRATAFRVA